MQKNIYRKIISFVLALTLMTITMSNNPMFVDAASNEVNIIHKISTATANAPIRYNFSLSRKSEINFVIRTNERTGITITVKEPIHETPVETIYLPASNPQWEYIKESGIYQNTADTNLDAGDYILEVIFEKDVNFDLSMNQIAEIAKLNKSKVSITKGFTFQLKVSGGTIKKSTSNNKSVATVTQKGKITAKKTGKAKVTVTLANGKKLTCTVTVKANKYNSKKPAISDIPYNTYGMKAYSASFDKKGNLVVKFTVANNSYGKIESIPKFAITVKDTKGNTSVSYKKSSYSVTVKSYSVKNCTVTVPKSSLKKNMKSIDLRTSKITVSGDSANAAF